MKGPDTKYHIDDFVEIHGRLLKVKAIEITIDPVSVSVRYFLADNTWYNEDIITGKVELK